MMNAGRRVRAHISALEQCVVENMLSAAPKETSVPALSIENTIPPASLASPSSLLPPISTSPASQYQDFATLMSSVASQSSPGIEEMEFPQIVDEVCSPHAAATQGWGPTSTSSYTAIPLRCTTCCDIPRPYTINTAKMSCCKFHAELSPPCNRHVHPPPWQAPPPWQDAGMWVYGGEAGANSRYPSIGHPPALRPQISTTQHFDIPQSIHTPSFSYCHNPRLPSWARPASLYPEHTSMRMSAHLFLTSSSGSTVDIVGWALVDPVDCRCSSDLL